MTTEEKKFPTMKVMAATIIILIIVVAAAAVYMYYIPKPVKDSDGDGVPDDLDEFPGFNDEEFRITYNADVMFDLTSMDPPRAAVGNMIVMLRPIYESLVQYKGGTYEIIPMLATSWEISPDGKTYTFHLRKGVKFHDLTEFNATAVQFSYMRSIKIGGAPGAYISMIESIDVIDTYTVRFNLKYAYRPFLAVLASYSGRVIMSPTYVKAHETAGDLGREWMHSHECGTGPYKLREWIMAKGVYLEWFPEYWGGWEPIQGKYPRIKKINFIYIPEYVTAKEMLKRGDVDTMEHWSPPDMEALNKTPGIIVENPASWNQWYITTNTKRPPLDNKLVRQAICWAINYTTVCEVLAPTASLAHGPIPKGLPYWDPSHFMYYKNVTKAKELLAQAGYPEGKGIRKLEYGYLAGVEHERIVGEQLVSDLKDIGIDLEIKPLLIAAWLEVYKDPRKFADLWIWVNVGPYADPDAILFSYFYSENLYPKGFNWGYFNSSEIDKLIMEARMAPEEKRAAIYNVLQYKLSDEAPAIYAYIWTDALARRDWLRGRVYNPSYSRSCNVYDMWKAGVPGRGY